MALSTYTTAGVNLLWSNNANWDTAPADGNTWIIPAGQTCTFDVDMTAYTGMGAGTINGTLQASTSTGSYVLKQAGNITCGASGVIRAGTNNGTRYPSDCTFHILFTGAYGIICGGTGNIQFWCKNPTNKWAIMTGAGKKAITGASKADPCQITCVAHGFNTDDIVYLTGLGGMVELNDQRFKIVDTGDDTFTLKFPDSGETVDSQSFTTYSSGGLACPSTAEVATATELHIDRDLSADTDWPVGARVRVDNWNRGRDSEPASSTPYTLASKTSDSVTLNGAGLVADKLSGSLVVLISRNVRISGSTSIPISGGADPGFGGNQLDVEISGCATTVCGIYNVSTIANQSYMTAGVIGLYGTAWAGPKSCQSVYGLVINGGVISGSDFALWASSNVTFSSGLISGCYGAAYASNILRMTGGWLSGCAYGTLSDSDSRLTGGTIRGLTNLNSESFQSLGAVTITNCSVANNYSIITTSGTIITGNGTGLYLSSCRILPGSIIRGSAYGMRESTVEVLGGTFSKNTRDVYSVNKVSGSGLSLNSTTQTQYVVNSVYGLYSDPRDGVRLWRPGGVDGLKVWTYPGTIVDRSGAEPDFSTTTGRTYTFRFYNAEQPLLLDIPILVEAGAAGRIVVDIESQLENSVISWTSVPKFELFRPGEDPLDGGTAEDTEQMTDNESVQTDRLTYSATSATAPEQMTLRISGQGGNGTTSQYLYVAWRIYTGTACNRVIGSSVISATGGDL